MSSGGRTAGLAALAISLLCAASAHAYTVRLGPESIPSSAPTAYYLCEGSCTSTLTAGQVSSVETYLAPAAGVITSWRVDGRQPLALRVLEPVAGGWTGAGTSEPASNVTGGANSTDLEIGAGDAIGVDVAQGGRAGFEIEGLPVGDQADSWLPPLGEGAAGRQGEPNPFANPGSRLMLSAEIELTPVVTSVSPASGSTAGGQSVTITGKYLDSVINVAFGSRPATSFHVDLAGEHITAQAPASSAGPVDVLVSNQRSTSPAVAADRYTFIAPQPTGLPGGPSGGAGGPGPGLSATPTVSGFTESAARWRRGSALPHIAATPVGTTFAFSLNEPRASRCPSRG